MAYGEEVGFRWWRDTSMVGPRRRPGNVAAVRGSITPAVTEVRRQFRRNPDPDRFQSAGRRSPPLEFVDGVCIINMDDPRFQRRQTTPSQAPFERRDGGLSDEYIAKHLKMETVVGGDVKFCVICQEEERERVGILRCGHEYHRSCISIWLQNSNICPLCKSTAL